MARFKQTKRTDDQESTEGDDNMLCGVCNKLVIFDDPLHPYIARCNVCGETSYIHKSRKCSNALYKTTVVGKSDKTNRIVDSAKFNEQQSVNLHCRKCRVNCFICVTEDHNFSEYNGITSIPCQSYYNNIISYF